MNFKDQLKQDFDNVFLHDFADTYQLIRNGTCIGSVKAVKGKRGLMCSTDADVRIGDVLSFDRNSYVVNGVSVADGALLLCSNPNRSHTVS